MRVYKLTHKVTEKVRFEECKNKKQAKTRAEFQEIISLHLNEKQYEDHMNVGEDYLN